MSDYMFMLESHLSADQNLVINEVQAAAGLAGVNVFLTGGAMRDMLGGFAIRDLDFSVEGNAVKVAKTVAERTGAAIVEVDENRRSAELLFPTGVTAEIAMARSERYARTGAKPQVTPASIQEDLRRRDFGINAIALSLNRGSRGLLLDPTNGLADLERHELRALSTYAFYDDPSRLLRLIRFRVRLGFTVDARTQSQYQNAREAEVEQHIPPRALFEELRDIALEASPGEVLKALDEEKLAGVFSPVLAGPKLNLAGFAKLDKAFHMVPYAAPAQRLGPFLYVLMEKLSPRERAALVKAVEMRKPEVELSQKLEARSKKLELALKSARIRKPSQVYQILSKAPADEIVFLLYRAANKTVVERIRNYFQKYLPAVQEMQAEELAALEGKPAAQRSDKEREEMIARHLDRKPVKPPAEPSLPPAESPALRARGR